MATDCVFFTKHKYTVMTKKIYPYLLLLFIVVISCNDELPQEENKDPERKGTLHAVEKLSVDGTFYQVPEGSSVEAEIQRLGKEFKRMFYTPAEESTLYLFTDDALFTTFIRDKYPAFDMNVLNAPEATDATGSKTSLFEGGRTQTACGEWSDFLMQFWYSDGKLGTTGCNLLPQYTMNFLDEPPGYNDIPAELDFHTPATGTISASVHWGEDRDNCPTLLPCWRPLLIFVPPSTSVTVENRVYNGFDNTRGKSMAWGLSRLPSDDLYLISDGTMHTVERSDGSGVPYLSNLSQNHIASAGGYIGLIDNGLLYRVNPYNGLKTQIDYAWEGTEAFTAGKVSSKPYVFGVQGGQLWKTELLTGVSVSIGSGWEGTENMVFGNGYLFIVQGDQLWRVNASNGSTVAIETGGWIGTEAMTFHGGYIYTVHLGSLWKTHPNGGSTYLGSGWDGTAAMTSYGSYMYILQGGQIWETDANGSTSSGRGSWPSGIGMTAVYQ
jgi:hypothetical protein